MALATLAKIMDLQKELGSRLRHHISVLLKRHHLFQKEVEGRKNEKEAASSEVDEGGGP